MFSLGILRFHKHHALQHQHVASMVASINMCVLLVYYMIICVYFISSNWQELLSSLHKRLIFGKKNKPMQFQKNRVTPWKINMEPKNHLFEKENHLNQTSMIMFQPLIFRGVHMQWDIHGTDLRHWKPDSPGGFSQVNEVPTLMDWAFAVEKVLLVGLAGSHWVIACGLNV